MNFPSPVARACPVFADPWLLTAAVKADEAFKWAPVETGGRDSLSTFGSRSAMVLQSQPCQAVKKSGRSSTGWR